MLETGIQGSNQNLAGPQGTVTTSASGTNSIRVMGNVLPANLERKLFSVYSNIKLSGSYK